MGSPQKGSNERNAARSLDIPLFGGRLLPLRQGFPEGLTHLPRQIVIMGVRLLLEEGSALLVDYVLVINEDKVVVVRVSRC